MNEREIVNWHEIIQEILDKHLSFMSGKIIKEAAREYPKYFLVDYYCLAEGELPEMAKKPITRPFDHLKEKNVIEYKSIHEVLNEKLFRHYVSRALFMETSDIKASYQGKMTLTILTTRRPETIIEIKEYAITPINDWKYQSLWIKDLEIYILVQKGMRGKKEGEALALLQILEGEKDRQIQHWQDIFSQELENIEILRQIAQQIGKEMYMNLVQELKKEGKLEGKLEGGREHLLKVLSWTAADVLKKYEKEIRNASTEKQLDAIEEKIRLEIEAR